MRGIFHIRLKELREKAGYSQYSLADALNIAQSTVGNWEAGKREPNFVTAQRIADFFNVTTDYLLGRTNDPAPPNIKSPVYDDEALELMEEMHKRPELKVLFSTTKKATRKDIEAVDKLLRHMAGVDDNGYNSDY